MVIVLTTYASLVIGEIVPKQIRAALARADRGGQCRGRCAGCRRSRRRSSGCSTSRAHSFSGCSASTASSRNQVTAEELHLVVAEAQTAGVLEEDERAMISGIVRLADRPVREVMTPRTDVDWIDVAATPKTRCARRCSTPPHSRIPVAQGIDREYRRRHPDRATSSPARCGASRSTSTGCAARRRSSPTSWTRWTRSRCCAAPTSRWRWSTTNMAISRAS